MLSFFKPEKIGCRLVISVLGTLTYILHTRVTQLVNFNLEEMVK